MYTFNRQFPHTRLRRLRISDGIREMVRETQLAPCHLIAPVFVIEGMNQNSPFIACQMSIATRLIC